MNIGASTSNFYPLTTEDSLDAVLRAGFRTVEVFFNASSELSPAFVGDLRRRAEAAGATVAAVHPYTSFMEPHFLFSVYERRALDMLEEYKREFEAAATLGAPYLILHGDREHSPLSVERSLERYERLYDLGKTFGVRVAQENVVRYRSADLAYLRALRDTLKDKAAFVLDVKQCVRCGLPVEQVAEAMGDAIVHVHVSDHDDTRDCLPPGQGTFDYARLFALLNERQYDGALMLELYRAGFEDERDLVCAAAFLQTFLRQSSDSTSPTE